MGTIQITLTSSGPNNFIPLKVKTECRTLNIESKFHFFFNESMISTEIITDCKRKGAKDATTKGYLNYDPTLMVDSHPPETKFLWQLTLPRHLSS